MENNTDKDWYPSDQPTERLMYENIADKIDAYRAKYPFLTSEYVAQIHLMCAMFIEGYDKIAQNRASAKALTTWFQNVVESRQTNVPVSKAPVSQDIEVPSGALEGLEQQCRGFARLMKSQSNYDKADGLDLMIERSEGTQRDLENTMPTLKLIVALDGTVTNEWKKSGFDMLEWQYRKAGTEMWQMADKSTEKIIEFRPPLTTPGVPEKFEFRAVYVLKNQRVGKWSPIYTLTVG